MYKITHPEHTSQFKLVKDPSSNRVNDLLIYETLPVTLYNNLLTIRNTEKKFELQGDLLKMITNKNCNIDLANLTEKKILYEFGIELYFDERALGKKTNTDKSPIRLLKSPAIKTPGISTIFPSGNFNEFCDRSKLSLQKKQAGNNSDIVNEEILAIADKLVEYKCISTNQQKFLLTKCLN